MIRVLVLFVLLFALAAGFSWLADRPGDVVMVWQGQRIETSVMAVAVGVVALVAVLMLGWSLLRGLWNTPGAIGGWWGRRRREKGWNALSSGMIAVGAGDPRLAAKQAAEARRILGDEPLALLLEAQSAQLSGDRAAARVAFEQMVEKPETQLLGLRGLYVEAQRHGEPDAARHFAEAAVGRAPGLAWAGQAVMDFDAQSRDWQGALADLDRNLRHKLVDKKDGKRLRAVLLTARALELQETEPDTARALAVEAHGLAVDLVPAAVLAGRLYSRAGEVKKAAKVLEATWVAAPHPDIAEAYAHARLGDSARDRMNRIKDLARSRNNHPEGVLALARAALEVRDFAEARATLKPLLTSQPTRRACLLMAEIEEAEHGDIGLVRGWLARALRAPRDPAWVADGVVSDHWLPVSPVTGKIDAFEWKVPPEQATGPIADLIDDAREALEKSGTLLPLEVTPASAPKVIEVAPVAAAPAIVSAAAPVAASAPVATAAEPVAPEATVAAETVPAGLVGGMPRPAQVPGGATVVPMTARAGTAEVAAAFPLKAPDDPGPDGADAAAGERKKLFGLF
ncbi:MAG: hypothetical protein JNM13_06720 [Hyphomicrobiaceae bacterium]|nr:hypothetical protein [Hyphomicrobiaceae bacterium]